MRAYFSNRLRLLAPIFIAPSGSLPPADPEDMVDFNRDFLRAGTPVFRIMFYAMMLALQVLCRLMRRKSLYSLPREEADDFIQSLYGHRIAALSAVPTLLGTAIYLSHYDRDDLQAHLGFDIAAMREEAAARGVQR